MPTKEAKLFNETFGGSFYLKMYTTKPSTGLTKGELLLLFHGSTPKLAVCSSTGGQTLKFVNLKNKTIGRLSNG